MANLLKFPTLKPPTPAKSIPELVNSTEDQEKRNIQQKQMIELQREVLEKQRIQTEEYLCRLNTHQPKR